ncbi:DUF1292 domain-containing protein [Roseburia sp. 499]|uniref:DUF1292 domain-containing protein n=1 Tax=Roseburia sp. 499 TaxID=1261634 RepID=UPI000951521D|nr:DUF1292 domain-containing protein [Roseburia sp. 499]WVK68505.1 DUF1292 domain-containing protein [Roseburia sp. 499]
MEKVTFRAPDSEESVEFYVVEQTKINGMDYLLVSVEEDGDSDAFILKDVSQENEEESVYEMVESEEELEYMSKIFAEILEDVDITL